MTPPPPQEFLNALIFLVLNPLISVDRKQNQNKLMNVRAFRLDDLPGDSPHKYLLAPTYLHWSSGSPPPLHGDLQHASCTCLRVPLRWKLILSFPILNYSISIRSDLKRSFRCFISDSEVKI